MKDNKWKQQKERKGGKTPFNHVMSADVAQFVH